MKIYKKIFGIFITFFFFLSSLPIHQAFSFENTALVLPVPGVMVTPSKPLVPIMLKGLQINPKDPLIFDFLVSKGDVTIENEQYTQEIERLARYFLASMAIPEKDLWVNLSPFEKENIITDALSKTEMGQSMLSQDYMLKQLTASMIYPEKALGKKFWGRVYEQVKVQFGDVNIPVNTFNKVWILADTANAVEKDNAVMITDAHLKVMLEEDFLAIKRNEGRVALDLEQSKERKAVTNIVRQIIVPEIEKEVNEGSNFAPLRQVFNAFVLSVWYKKNLKQSILNDVYADKSKLGGIEANDLNVKQQIYDRYVQAYKKGVFNYIKEVEHGEQKRIPRKYFSGGEVISAKNVTIIKDAAMFDAELKNPLDKARVQFDAAMASKSIGSYLSVIDRTNTRFLSEQAQEVLQQKSKDITVSVINQSVLDDTRGLGVNVNVKVKVIADQNNLWNGKNIIPHGFMIEYSNDSVRDNGNEDAVIYVTTSFLKQIEENDGLFYFFARKIYKIYAPIGKIGRQDEVDIIKKKIENEKKANKGRSKTENKLLKRIPKGSLPWNLINRELNALLVNPNLVELLKEENNSKYVKYFQDRVKDIFPDWDLKVVSPKKVPFDASREAYELAIKQANLKLISAMDGIANYADNFPETVKGMMERLDQGKPITFAFGASKYNPSSIGHITIMLDGALSHSGASNYLVNVTFEDVRKPSVKKSANQRLILAKADIEGIFESLFTILDVKEHVDGRNLGKFNGEEAFYLILKALIPHGLKDAQFYVAGEDHFFVWAPFGGNPKNKTIQWDLMDDHTRLHYTFYVSEFDGEDWKVYQELVTRQNNLLTKDHDPSLNVRSFYSEEDDEATQKIKEAIIQGIIKAKTKKLLLEVLEAAPVLPRLDTVGKMVAINRVVERSGVSAVLVVPLREDVGGKDVLRDQLIDEDRLSIMPIEGINHPVSATLNRKFLELLASGVFDYNYGYGLTMETLKNMYQNPEIFRMLVRQSDVKLPKALPLLMPYASPLKDASKEKKAKLKSALNLLYQVGDEDLSLDESIHEIHNPNHTSSRFVSIISLKDRLGKEIVKVTYDVKNSVDEKHERGQFRDENTVEYFEQLALFDDSHSQEALSLVKDYIKELNDAAMSTDVPDFNIIENSDVGGIEFNQNDLKLNIRKDGQGVQFDFDPELLKQLQSEDFSGFKPTVLGITPMTVARPMVQ